MPKTNVKASVRKDGVKVKAHLRTAPVPGQDAAAAAATMAAAVAAGSDALAGGPADDPVSEAVERRRRDLRTGGIEMSWVAEYQFRRACEAAEAVEAHEASPPRIGVLPRPDDDIPDPRKPAERWDDWAEACAEEAPAGMTFRVSSGSPGEAVISLEGHMDSECCPTQSRRQRQCGTCGSLNTPQTFVSCAVDDYDALPDIDDLVGSAVRYRDLLADERVASLHSDAADRLDLLKSSVEGNDGHFGQFSEGDVLSVDDLYDHLTEWSHYLSLHDRNGGNGLGDTDIAALREGDEITVQAWAVTSNAMPGDADEIVGPSLKLTWNDRLDQIVSGYDDREDDREQAAETT